MISRGWDSGGQGGSRTLDALAFNQPLFRLSYLSVPRRKKPRGEPRGALRRNSDSDRYRNLSPRGAVIKPSNRPITSGSVAHVFVTATILRLRESEQVEAGQPSI